MDNRPQLCVFEIKRAKFMILHALCDDQLDILQISIRFIAQTAHKNDKGSMVPLNHTELQLSLVRQTEERIPEQDLLPL